MAFPCIAIGPFGGPGGNKWDDRTYNMAHNTVRQMIIYHGDVVNSIQTEYEDENGKSVWSPVHGGTTNKKDEVKLDYPNEFLISISGYTAEYASHVVVWSLTITSNKKKYGPYGTERGEYFSTTSRGGKIVGFYGRNGTTLDSIGAYFLSLPNETLAIGPFGGSGPSDKVNVAFNDGTFGKVKKIVVRYNNGDNGKKPFVSIQTVYFDENGSEHWSPEHGTTPGGVVHEVNFDSVNPDSVINRIPEYLVSISGYFIEDSSNGVVIQSLIFQSTKQQYGPYGKAEGKFFSTSATGGHIIGFFGTSGEYINSLGAYFAPLIIPL